MAEIKVSILKKYNWFIKLVLSLLGFQLVCTHCAKEYGTPSVEYGVPSATFEIVGTITDSETGEGLEDIEIGLEKSDGMSSSNSTGTYRISQRVHPEDHTHVLNIRDVDSTKNGYYEDKDTLVDFKLSDIEESGDDWDAGTAKQTLNIKLDKKKE